MEWSGRCLPVPPTPRDAAAGLSLGAVVTPSNFRILNRVLAFHGWEITSRTSEQQLIRIAKEVAELTEAELYDCVGLVSALFAEACKHATAPRQVA